MLFPVYFLHSDVIDILQKITRIFGLSLYPFMPGRLHIMVKTATTGGKCQKRPFRGQWQSPVMLTMDVRPYYQDDGFTLYHGDCIHVMEQMPKGEVDLIFADPPYNLSNGGFTCQSGKRASVNKGSWDESHGIEDDFVFHTNWIRACKRVLSEQGSIWISGTYHSIYACGFALQKEGFHVLNDICWFKPNASPNLSTRYFTASHETLLWAKKAGKAKHMFNYQEMKCGDWKEDSLKRPGKQMRTVWSIPTPRNSEKSQGSHPTQKPLALLKRIILSCSREDALVLDPFTGSSTTGLAACILKRRFLGIDTDTEYLDISVRRYREMRNPGRLEKEEDR